MLQDSWCFYEERAPRKWIFHTRRRSLAGPALVAAALLMAALEAVSRF